MPITEQVIDTVAHLLYHYSEEALDGDDLDLDDLDPEALAAWAEAHCRCGRCADALARAIGAPRLADAFALVLASEAWHAFLAHLEAAADDDEEDEPW